MDDNIYHFDSSKEVRKNISLPKSGYDYLSETLIKNNVVDNFNVIVNAFNPIRRITISFCEYLTDIIPSQNKKASLLSVCINQAVLNWYITENSTNSVLDSYISYIRGLIVHLDEITGVQIYFDSIKKNKQNRQIWEPLDGPLSQKWIREKVKPKCIKKIIYKGFESGAEESKICTNCEVKRKILYTVLNSKDIIALKNEIENIVMS